MQNFSFQPIGIFYSNASHKYDRRRQARGASSPEEVQTSSIEDPTPGIIQLQTGQNLEQAVQGLSGFDHIWLIYVLHRNHGWKPMVRPPGFARKQGVFATRAPYRPNPIGMSAVRLLQIDGLQIYVGSHDLLDQTPILDIKPYLPYCDSIPVSAIGWRTDHYHSYRINFSQTAQLQLNWLVEHGLHNLPIFIQEQLQFEPSNKKRKRVQCIDREAKDWMLAYRLWRIQFRINEQAHSESTILVQAILSSYSTADLANPDDPYQDKTLHRKFLQAFPI